ncbi:hypothetical protein BS50DRAFT_651034 [Corynespora cassiicola Philippines]|uniref:C2H2-type domain-containing protein n=1 Tax=Corynespora cassiicola Philippines TaxID=1448308 RepID=A0A2T2N8C0_CORCC|nr:hypothetical protein BS50DRAFT_651034 [Corynespora cassiicola Philippines]
MSTEQHDIDAIPELQSARDHGSNVHEAGDRPPSTTTPTLATDAQSSRCKPPPSTPAQPPALAASPLNTIPPDIATHRALLFALDTPVQLTDSVWGRFWPFIDNVWCLHQKPHPSPSTGIAKVYGGCRLNRKTNFPPPTIHENSRPRQRREGGTCKAKFRLTIHSDGRRVVERTGEGHSHTLEHIDAIKRNSGVRNLVLNDFFKSWEAGGILAFLRDTSAHEPTKDLLKGAGGLYLSRQEVQNVMNGALKKAYPGQDVSEVKKQMDKYKNYATCNYKGCNAAAFPDIKALMDHRKTMHGLKAHDHSDKQYSCPDKACWRRKKSKGFATLLGLEEHLRDKHGATPQDAAAAAPGLSSLDPVLAVQMPPMSSIALNMNLGMSAMNSHAASLPDPITPVSSVEEQHDSRMSERDIQAEDASRALTHMERESMEMRIKRLQIEREKLDLEIKRLKKAVYGDESSGNGIGEADAG